MLEDYDNNRALIKTGDAIQWKSNSLLGWLIRKFSGGNVNHTSLVLRVNEYNRVLILEALEKGIVPNGLSHRLKTHRGEAWWLPLKNEWDDKRSLIAQWAFDQIGTKYDYDSLFKQILGKVSANAKQLFCSEFAYLSYLKANIPMENPSGKAPRPADMPSLGIFMDEIRIK